MMDKLIFEIVLAIVVAIAGIIAKSLIPFLRAKKEEALAKMREAHMGVLADIVDAAVNAVEQTVDETIHGEDKKRIAAQYIYDICKQNNIEISESQISTLIEAAVKAMNDNEGTLEVELPAEPDQE